MIKGLSASTFMPARWRQDPLSLAAITAGEYRDVTGALMAHPLEEIPTGMDVELPVRRLPLAGVEADNPRQVIDEVRPDWRLVVKI